MFRRGNGFTLIELLVVTSIIGLLSSVTLAALSSARMKARDARRLADARVIVAALELYRDRYGVFPGPVASYGEGEVAAPPAGCGGWDTSAQDLDGDGRPFLEPLIDAGFLSTVPVDPLHQPITTCYSDFMYRYYLYSAGQSGCPAERGQIYVFIINKFESIAGQHPASPGFACSLVGDWSGDGRYVVGSLTN